MKTLIVRDTFVEAPDIRKILESVPSVSFTERKRLLGFFRVFTITGRDEAVDYAHRLLREYAEAEQASRQAW